MGTHMWVQQQQVAQYTVIHTRGKGSNGRGVRQCRRWMAVAVRGSRADMYCTVAADPPVAHQYGLLPDTPHISPT